MRAGQQRSDGNHKCCKDEGDHPPSRAPDATHSFVQWLIPCNHNQQLILAYGEMSSGSTAACSAAAKHVESSQNAGKDDGFFPRREPQMLPTAL